MIGIDDLIEKTGIGLEEIHFRSLIFGLVPALCTTCGHIDDMEPDQAAGYCEACGGQTVVSALVLEKKNNEAEGVVE